MIERFEAKGGVIISRFRKIIHDNGNLTLVTADKEVTNKMKVRAIIVSLVVQIHFEMVVQFK